MIFATFSYAQVFRKMSGVIRQEKKSSLKETKTRRICVYGGRYDLG